MWVRSTCKTIWHESCKRSRFVALKSSSSPIKRFQAHMKFTFVCVCVSPVLHVASLSNWFVYYLKKKTGKKKKKKKKITRCIQCDSLSLCDDRVCCACFEIEINLFILKIACFRQSTHAVWCGHKNSMKRFANSQNTFLDFVFASTNRDRLIILSIWSNNKSTIFKMHSIAIVKSSSPRRALRLQTKCIHNFWRIFIIISTIASIWEWKKQRNIDLIFTLIFVCNCIRYGCQFCRIWFAS